MYKRRPKTTVDIFIFFKVYDSDIQIFPAYFWGKKSVAKSAGRFFGTFSADENSAPKLET